MKYKAEVLNNSKVRGQYYFNNLTHPNQVVRNVVSKNNGRLNYFVVLIINDMGEMWNYSVMKQKNGKYYIRKMYKSDVIYTRDDLDMIFSGNRCII